MGRHSRRTTWHSSVRGLGFAGGLAAALETDPEYCCGSDCFRR